MRMHVSAYSTRLSGDGPGGRGGQLVDDEGQGRQVVRGVGQARLLRLLGQE